MSILETNLNFIKIYNPELVTKILEVTELSKEIQFLEAKSGDTILSYDNVIMDDAIDPVEDAYKNLQQLPYQDADNIFVVFGLGVGYRFKRFCKNCAGKVVLFEPNLEILRLILETVDFSQELKKQNVIVVNNTDEFRQCIAKGFTYGLKIYINAGQSYINMYTDLYRQLYYSFEKINPKEVTDIDIKLNIGAGRWQKEGWKTLDCYLDSDIKFDLRRIKPLPLKDNSISKVFSSHCIEHIETHHLENLLKELFRCMKPGTLMRLACPDADQAFEAYKNNNIRWFDGIYTLGEIGAKLVNTFVSYEAGQGGPKVSEEEVKEKFYSLSKDEFIDWAISLCDRNRPYIAHINGIYYEKLEKLLENAGFVNIVRSSFKNSQDEELRGEGFDLHESVSLFVECNKP